MAKRVPKGSGTITQRGNTWQGRYTVGRCPETGKQIRKTVTAKTKEECRIKLTALTGQYDRDGYLPDSEITLEQWLQEWYTLILPKRLKNGKIKARTIENYVSICDNHLIPKLGKVRLSQLTGSMIEDFINGLEMSSSTINLFYTVLKTSLKKAVQKKRLVKNPCEAVDTDELPAMVKREVAPLDDKGLALFKEAIKGHELENLYLVALGSGCRQGEVIGLQWTDICFKTNVLNIDKQLQRNGEHEPTKNSNVKTLELPKFAIEALKAQKSRQAQYQLTAGQLWQNKLNLVFTDGVGSPIKHVKVSREFKKIVTSIGYPDAYFHGLRHTNATMQLRDNQVDITTVQKRLGHRDSKTTGIYLHKTAHMDSVAADVLDKQFREVRIS